MEFFLHFSFSCSLLIYRKATDFFGVDFVSYNFDEFMNSFFCTIIRVLHISDIVSEQRKFYFFSNFDAFYFFSCLISLTRISNTVLNRNGESGHTCFVPSLLGNAFSLSPSIMMLSVGFSYMVFCMLSSFLIFLVF